MTSYFDFLHDLHERKRKVEDGGGIEKMKKQHEKGKLSARERIHLLVDDDSFVEFQTFASPSYGELDHAPGDGVVTGFGKVDGRPVYVFSQDFTVYGGALGERHAQKIAHVMDLAAQNKAPIIGLNDSGGARIQEGVVSLDGYGHVFHRNVLYSGVIPQISVIMGPCAGGAVYSPAITDFVFMVDGTSQMFITGPKVIEQVTGEKITSEALGGSVIHASKSGNAHIRCGTEEEILIEVRKLLSYLPSSFDSPCPQEERQDHSLEHDRPNLYDLVPMEGSKPYDVRNVLAEIFDRESFFEIHREFARNLVVGFARLNGQTVGIVANQPKFMAGGLDIDSSDKGARFIRFCDSFSIPLLTFEDVTGFFPGVKQEHGGIIRHGAKLLFAYSEATVPKVTMILRKAYGGAYVALNSKAIGADLVFAWPNAEIAVMGAEGAASIIYAKEIAESEDPVKTKQEKLASYREEISNPYVAAARGMVDDVIDPRDSRIKLIQALNMLKRKEVLRPNRKHGNIPL